MGLTQTRPEKAEAMSRLVYALRNAIAESVQKDGLNIAEAINASGQLAASLLVGAYRKKERDMVLSMYPDLVEGYFPQWEQIYADHAALVNG